MHKECIRVLPYEDTNCQVYVQLYVFCDKNEIPEELKAAAQEFFGETGVKLKWTNLYNYTSNKPNIVSEDFKQLEVSQVNYIGDIIKRNLPVFSKHRNITAIQPSLKVTNSKQTNNPCIRVYVLGKGRLPFDESEIPKAVENRPVDIVDGFWLETSGTPKPLSAHTQGEYLRLGASIEVKGTGNGGTLGAIVKDHDGEFYILSCDHVMRSVIDTKIIHPTKNHHSTSLEYHLIVYHNWINRIFDQDHPFQHNHPDLVKYFQQLEERVESFYSGRYRHPKLRECEGKLRKLISEPPRTVACFIDGICENRGNFYIDVAVAKLTEEEREALKRNGYVEIIDTEDYPDGSVTNEDSQNVERQWRKSGSSTGYTSLKTKFSLSCVYLRKSARERPSSTSGGSDPRDFEWCNNCIVLKHEENNLFSKIGDSGAVVFEKINEQLPGMPGFGIVIADLVPSNEGNCTIVIPLCIALDQLSEKLGSKLTLVSALQTPPGYMDNY